MRTDELEKQECSHSVYHLNCIKCCAKLVVSARPSRERQESMLAICERYNRRDKILEEIRKWSL